MKKIVCKRPVALLLCIVMILSVIPILPVAAQMEGRFQVCLKDEAVKTVAVPRNGYITLTAEGAGYRDCQWQIKAAPDLWVDIQGEDEAVINLRYAMVASMMTEGVASIRCVSGSDATDAIAVTLDPAMPEFEKTEFVQEIIVEKEATVVETPAVDMDALRAEYEDANEAAIAAEDRYNAAVAAQEAAKAAFDAAAAAEAEAKAAYEAAPEDEVLKSAWSQAVQDMAAAKSVLEEKEAALSEEKTASDVTVKALDTVAVRVGAAMAQQKVRTMATEEDPGTTYSIVINYVFGNGYQAAHPYVANVAEGSSLNVTVNSPSVLGYAPDQAVVTINEPDVQGNIVKTVTYGPALVNYTVRHYIQNIDNDEYTEYESETKTGYTESPVGDGLQKSYEGCYALLYDTTDQIAADGSTEVEIYYDRYYYLMNFVLGEDGYGVEPLYERYGKTIARGEPTRAGYTFTNWLFNGRVARVPNTMPAENRTYTANWVPNATAKVTVIFWGENANDNQYSYYHSGTVEAPIDEEYTYSEDKEVLICTEDHNHGAACYQKGGGMDAALWNFDRSETVTVASDDTSIVNVYYKRKHFTLRFTINGSKTEPISYGDEIYRIEAKWGSFIGNHFPITGSNGITYDDGERWSPFPNNTFPEMLVYIRVMPKEDIIFTSNISKYEIINMYYMVETLPGETGTASYTFNNETKKFKQDDLIKARYSRVTLDEDFFDLEGFKQWTSNPKYTTCSSCKIGNIDVHFEDGGTIYHYYERLQYDLAFYNYNEELTEETEQVYFEEPLGDHLLSEPPYPDVLEPGAYEFEGWYYEEILRNEVKATDEMPADNVLLYAKWVPKIHKVNFYLTEEDVSAAQKLYEEQNITHGELITAVEAPSRGEYEFVGWFYRDSEGEHAFDIENMPVTHDLDLYARWSSNKLMSYTIQYALDGNGDSVADTDEQGNVIYIADPATGSGLAGTTKFFDAKSGRQLHEGYRAHYYPVTNSHSITFDIEGGNDFTFLYVYREELPYTVRYLEVGTEKPLHPEKNEITKDDVVTETFVAIKGYMPDAYQKRLVLSASIFQNVITFWYQKDDIHAPLHIGHYTQNIQGDGYTLYRESTVLDALIGDQYSEDPLTIPGFAYNAEKSIASGNMTADGLDLKLYYDRIQYPYEFRFLEQGTDREIAESITGTARYQDRVTQNARTIPGYALTSAERQTVSIMIEDPAAVAKNNVRIFYYQEQDVTVRYVVVGPDGALNPSEVGSVAPASETVKAATGVLSGSVAAPASNAYKFAGWYQDAECTQPVDESWLENDKILPQKTGDKDASGTAHTFEAAVYYAKFEHNLTTMTIQKAGEAYDSTDTFIFDIFHDDAKITTVTLKLGGSITVSGLTIGETYTVSERTSGTRYESREPQKITMKVDAAENSVTFTNKVVEHKWLSMSGSEHNVFNGKD